MDSITLQNYRCFGSEAQTARLAPLTLLVGPNSTGKTSFLALIRALWDVAFREVVPNFREEPYDLGSFEDIVHQAGGRSKPPKSFTAGFEFWSPLSAPGMISAHTAFSNYRGVPFPELRGFSRDDVSMEARVADDGCYAFSFRVGERKWDWLPPQTANSPYPTELLSFLMWRFNRNPFAGPNHEAADTDVNAIDELYASAHRNAFDLPRPFASSPVRSRPRRTYDPMMLAQDAEGDYIPSYLANQSRRDADEWQLLKERLEEFGKSSELFDEISVRSFGKSDRDPFQIQVRKFGKRRKGPWRNLIDVGYGVSQALPVLTELLRPDALTMLLLQQPEVHLHPQAQAALGTLFCQVAAGGRQLVIETHSDYIIDRVRMDVRDGTTGLKPEDVSILYFEPGDLSVKIHSIRIDQAGNVLDAPRSYGNFFMDEVSRSIGLRKG